MTKERLGIFVSGNGTTAEHIVNQIKGGNISGLEVACFVACHENVPAIQRARKAGVREEDIVVADPQKFKDESGQVNMDKFGEELLFELKKRGVSVVSQNGWLHITPDVVVDAFHNSIFNQHPGRLEFGGMGMYGKRVDVATLEFERLAGRKIGTQATVHRVTHDVDEGAIVGKVYIPTQPGDTSDSLHERILPLEHSLITNVLNDFVSGSLTEFPREKLLLSGEEVYLAQAKEYALKEYPQGHNHRRLAS